MAAAMAMELAIAKQADMAAVALVAAPDTESGVQSQAVGMASCLEVEKEQERVAMAMAAAVAGLEPGVLKAVARAAVLVPVEAMAQSLVEDLGTAQALADTAAVPDITAESSRALLEEFLQVLANRAPVVFAFLVPLAPSTAPKVEQVRVRPLAQGRGILSVAIAREHLWSLTLVAFGSTKRARNPYRARDKAQDRE
jgi:hypothetical protein